MKIDKKYYPLIAIAFFVLLFLFIRGAGNAKQDNYDYVPIPNDGVG